MTNLTSDYVRLAEKAVAPPPVASAPKIESDIIPLNASVAIKPRACKARDLKSTMVTLDYGIVCVFVVAYFTHPRSKIADYL